MPRVVAWTPPWTPAKQSRHGPHRHDRQSNADKHDPAACLAGNQGVGKISLVGVGIRSHTDVAARMLEALAGEGINLRMIATSEIKVSVLVNEKDLESGVRCLHDTFGLDCAAGPETPAGDRGTAALGGA